MKDDKYLRRAEVATLLGENTSTIKFWERSIKAISRCVKQLREGSSRLYTKEAVACFREVQRLSQEKRWSINEIAKFFEEGGLTLILNDEQIEPAETATSLDQRIKVQVQLEEAIEQLEKLKGLL